MDILIISLLLVIAAEATYLVTTHIKKAEKTALAPVFVDTSVLIDGRIIAIAASGFMNRPLYIPRSVVGELQFLADTGDSDKRARARHGLDVINELQSMPRVTVKIFADGVRAEEGVDNRLMTLAKKHSGSVCTIDYNLNKVAVVEGIEVLNVNDLAKTLRMAYLPGEHLHLELTQKGNDSHQAVGHLGDGTMVVVEHAFKHIGSTVEVEFTRALQTAAGKMMFAKLVQPTDTNKTQKAPKVPKTAKVLKGQKPPVPPQRHQAHTKSAGADPVAVSTPASRPNGRKTTSQSSSPAKRPQRGRRTHEDSMVELANNSSNR